MQQAGAIFWVGLFGGIENCIFGASDDNPIVINALLKVYDQFYRAGNFTNQSSDGEHNVVFEAFSDYISHYPHLGVSGDRVIDGAVNVRHTYGGTWLP